MSRRRGWTWDLNVLRALLGEQADLIRTSSEQSLGKLQAAWMQHFVQLGDKSSGTEYLRAAAVGPMLLFGSQATTTDGRAT